MSLYLFKRVFKHHSEKSSAEGILDYVIAHNEREVMESLMNLASWEEEDMIDVWSENMKKIIEVPKIEKLLRDRGDWEDEPIELWWGFTHHGWEEGIQIFEEEAAILIRLGVALDIRDRGE